MKYFRESFETVKNLQKSPKKVFEQAKKQKNLKPIIIFYAVILFVSSILQAISDVTLQPAVASWLAQTLKVAYTYPQITIDVVLFHLAISVVGMLVLVGPIYGVIVTSVLFIWSRLWRGKGNFKDTFKLYVYSMTPMFLFSWLPFISIVGWIYSGYLLIVGSQVIAGFSKRKATILFGIPFVIIIVFSILGLWASISYLQGV